MSYRSLVEEFRKTLCSLWQGNQTAFSPDSLFYAIWKIMPSFRYFNTVHRIFQNKDPPIYLTVKVYLFQIIFLFMYLIWSLFLKKLSLCYTMFVCPGDINSKMPMSLCVTCWTTSTGSCSTAAMGHLSRSHLRMESKSLHLTLKKCFFSFKFNILFL